MAADAGPLATALRMAATKPKEIIKEGPERVFHLHHRRHGDDPQRLVETDAEFRGANAPLKIQYRYRPPEYGDQLVRMYLLTNDKDSKLGHHAAAGRHGPRLPPERPRRA